MLSVKMVILLMSVGVIAFFFTLYLQQDGMLYQTGSVQQSAGMLMYFRSPADYGFQYQDIHLKTPDQQQIHGWFIPAHRVHRDDPQHVTPLVNGVLQQHIKRSLRSLRSKNRDSHDSGADDDNDETHRTGNHHESDEDEGSSHQEDIIDLATPGSALASNHAPASRDFPDLLLASSPYLAKVDACSTYDPLSATAVAEDIPTLLFLHENAGTLHSRILNIYGLIASCCVNVLIIDYRGYGQSTGHPSEEGLLLDAAVAYAYLHTRPDINPRLIYVFGRSLGGAVGIGLTAAVEAACTARMIHAQVPSPPPADGSLPNTSTLHANLQTALQPSSDEFIHDLIPLLLDCHPVVGLMVENTFTSIYDLVGDLMPFIAPFRRLLLRLRWDSVGRVKYIKNTPLLAVIAEKDEIVPPTHMAHLFKAYPCTNKQVHVVHGANHNNTWLMGGIDYFAQYLDFIQTNTASRVEDVRLIHPIPHHQEQTDVNQHHGWVVQRINTIISTLIQTNIKMMSQNSQQRQQQQ